MKCMVVITREDNVYIAKDIKTSVTDEGDTIEEALANLKEALELYYDDNDMKNDQDEMMFTTTLEVCM